VLLFPLVACSNLCRDTWEIASFAKEYVATNGPEDPIFQMYFGNQSDAFSRVLGVWESLLTSNKDGVLLRCDDIDGVSSSPSLDLLYVC
jgi:hypothetical protein